MGNSNSALVEVHYEPDDFDAATPLGLAILNSSFTQQVTAQHLCDGHI
jgi:hypothetical protein